jgi:hypothetical protein
MQFRFRTLLIAMAIFIQINRVDDTPEDAVYEFGSVDQIVGQVCLHKADGRVELFEINPETTARADFYLSRVTQVLARYHAVGEYPVRTDYRA